MSSPDIAFIINSFNRVELLRQSLGVLSLWVPYSEFKGRCVAVVFDAGSTDGSIEWLRGDARNLGIQLEVIIPEAGADSSFAAGINDGAAYAKRKYPSLKYLLFYETDNQILKSEALARALVQLEQRPSLAGCGFTVRQHDGSPAGVGMPFPTLFNFAVGKNVVHKFQLEAVPYKWQIDAEGVEFSEIDVVFTSPLLVKIEAWNASGGLDERMFPFSDCDVDWARRLRDIGWRLGVIKSNDVIHDNMSSISSWSKSRAVQFHRGRLRYFKRYHPVKVFAVWPVPLLMRHVLELLTVKLFVKGQDRRLQLSNQFKNLFRYCINNYEE